VFAEEQYPSPQQILDALGMEAIFLCLLICAAIWIFSSMMYNKN
jgi:hypothetical protein